MSTDAWYHALAQVHKDVLPLCAIDDRTRAFSLPSPASLAQARVVVTTCGAAGMLREGDYAQAVAAAEFSHVMIDEAGQVCGALA